MQKSFTLTAMFVLLTVFLIPYIGEIEPVQGNDMALTRSVPDSIDILDEWTYNFTAMGGGKEDFAGSSLAAGDINGDGKQDIIIGVPLGDGIDPARDDSGEVFVIFGDDQANLGGEIDLANTFDLRFHTRNTGSKLGSSVAVGDIDNDNIDDIIIAAPEDTGPGSRTKCGSVHVVFGDAGFTSGQEFQLSSGGLGHLTIWGPKVNNNMGNTVASGDVDGDNYDDMIIGALNGAGPSGSKDQAGEVYIIFGDSQGALGSEKDLLTDFSFTAFMGPDKYDKLGASLAVGDIDGDGKDDIAMSAPYASGLDNGRSDCGEVHIYFGRETFENSYKDLKDFSDLMIYGSKSGELLGKLHYDPGEDIGIGNSLAIGDIDNDGKGDLIIGAEEAQLSKGKAYVVFGDTQENLDEPIDLAVDAGLTIISKQPSKVGQAVGCADINKDSYDDIILGAGTGDGPEENRDQSGEVRILLGLPRDQMLSQVDIDLGYDVVLFGESWNTRFGQSIGTGDINNDGYIEVLIGSQAPVTGQGNDPRESRGKAHVFFGDEVETRPKIVKNIPDMNMKEDLPGHLHLDEFFQDLAGFSGLSFSMAGDDSYIKYELLGNNSYEFTAPENYYGKTQFNITCRNKGLDGTPGNSDDKQITSNTFWVNFLPQNDPPELTTSNVLSVDEDIEYSVQYEATDIDGDNILFTLYTNASWLKIDGGRVYGTPRQNHIGIYFVNVSYNDQNGSVRSTNFTLTVNSIQDPPVFVDIVPDLSFYEDSWKVLDLEGAATDIDGDPIKYYLSNKSAELYDVTGEETSDKLNFTAKPDVNGKNTVILWAEDPDGNTDQQNLTITIIPVNDPPVAQEILVNNIDYRMSGATSIWEVAFATNESIDIDSDPKTLDYMWDFGDDKDMEIGKDKEKWHKYTKSGEYTITLTVEDEKGASSTVKKTITLVTPADDDDDDNVVVDTDTDKDNLPDDWEMKYFKNLDQGQHDDWDNDGLTNWNEYNAGSNPTVPEGGYPEDDDDGGGLSITTILAIGGVAIVIVIIILVIVVLLVMRSTKKKTAPPPPPPAEEKTPGMEGPAGIPKEELPAVDQNEVDKYMDMFTQSEPAAPAEEEAGDGPAWQSVAYGSDGVAKTQGQKTPEEIAQEKQVYEMARGKLVELFGQKHVPEPKRNQIMNELDILAGNENYNKAIILIQDAMEEINSSPAGLEAPPGLQAPPEIPVEPEMDYLPPE